MAGGNGASAPDVFDLDALERDETGEPFVFTLAGQTFTCSDPGDIDWHDAEALERGTPSVLFRSLLGDQYDDFEKIPLPSWKLNRLVEAWGAHIGVDLGELAASSGSSGITAARSRPTSRTTTRSGSRTSRRGG